MTLLVRVESVLAPTGYNNHLLRSITIRTRRSRVRNGLSRPTMWRCCGDLAILGHDSVFEGEEFLQCLRQPC
jgi:hypothetical protein